MYILSVDKECKTKLYQNEDKKKIMFYASTFSENYPNKVLYLFKDGELIQTFKIEDKEE